MSASERDKRCTLLHCKDFKNKNRQKWKTSMQVTCIPADPDTRYVSFPTKQASITELQWRSYGHSAHTHCLICTVHSNTQKNCSWLCSASYIRTRLESTYSKLYKLQCDTFLLQPIYIQTLSFNSASSLTFWHCIYCNLRKLLIILIYIFVWVGGGGSSYCDLNTIMTQHFKKHSENIFQCFFHLVINRINLQNGFGIL